MYELSKNVCADYAFGGRELVREWFGIYARNLHNLRANPVPIPHQSCINYTAIVHKLYRNSAQILQKKCTNYEANWCVK